jgi:hypothetical protein
MRYGTKSMFAVATAFALVAMASTVVVERLEISLHDLSIRRTTKRCIAFTDVTVSGPLVECVPMDITGFLASDEARLRVPSDEYEFVLQRRGSQITHASWYYTSLMRESEHYSPDLSWGQWAEARPDLAVVFFAALAQALNTTHRDEGIAAMLFQIVKDPAATRQSLDEFIRSTLGDRVLEDVSSR